MSPFRYNEHTDHFEARDGGHSISIADHVWMTEFERLQNEEGMLSDEAFNTLDRVSWWYEQLPRSGVFIDGMEQQDGAEESLRVKEQR